MATAERLLSVLARHVGRGNGINVKRLAEMLGVTERKIRAMVSLLRDEGNAVCGTPHDGYYIAANQEELQETLTFLKNRAMHSLRLASRLANIPLPDLIGQLHIPT